MYLTRGYGPTQPFICHPFASHEYETAMRIILIAASIVSSQGSERSVRSYQFRTDKDPVLIAFHGEKYEQRTPALESGM